MMDDGQRSIIVFMPDPVACGITRHHRYKPGDDSSIPHQLIIRKAMIMLQAKMAAPPVDAYRNKILPLRDQAAVRNGWLRQRLDELLPLLMQRTGIDLWIVAAREYNEDPVIMTLLPEPSMAARRRTILVFALGADGQVERLTLDRYGFGDFYTRGWEPGQEGQFAALRRIVQGRNP